MTSGLVGAVFANRSSAAAAAEELHIRGLAPRDVTTAVWSGDRYVIESHAGADLRRGLRTGAVIGAVVGAVVGAVALSFLWTSPPLWGALLLGALFGGGSGSLLGAYLGINRRRPELWDERDWIHVDLGEGEVLVVIAPNEAQEAAAVLDRRGRIVEPVHP